MVRVWDEHPATRHYMVLYLKQGGRWKYASVREEQEPGLTRTSGSRSWHGSSGSGSTRAPTPSCTSPADGARTATSSSATSWSACRASRS